MKVRRTGALVLVASCVLALSGCSDDEGPGVTIDSSESPSTSGSPSASPSTAEPTSSGELDQKGHDVVAGKVDATGDGKAVADAWIAYWTFRLAAYHEASVNSSDLAEVASGPAAEEVVGYVNLLSSKGRHTEGDMSLDVDQVRVNGQQATLRSCVTNQSTDRDAKGKRVEPLTPFYELKGTLKSTGGTWRVTDLAVVSQVPCT